MINILRNVDYVDKIFEIFPTRCRHFLYILERYFSNRMYMCAQLILSDEHGVNLFIKVKDFNMWI